MPLAAAENAGLALGHVAALTKMTLLYLQLRILFALTQASIQPSAKKAQPLHEWALCSGLTS